ncbi:PHA/PHB synthase family protein [Defluviimonas salinarum]|uniref:Alpha/beta fold hydrolase n=1 Tax=Defluviimonas salinarum TaxID=2992147 RepID=A0ABT3JAF0_9RHOB|nr:alpha/beta fold hydrolase [Defluviimonas salinarum]MCW3780392.1 alpha/beta fold hydrolase [Defluviimonas salinarum]MCW3784684.1 alpha/beta fold hydrolase [Defluviimonas salinarum]
MDQDVMKKLSEMMLAATRSHPLFAGMEPSQLSDLADGWAKAAQAMAAPNAEAWGEWVRTWSSYQSEMTNLWLSGLQGKQAHVEPSRDRRFGDEAWNEGIFPLMRQSYELASKAMVDLADKAGLPAHEQRKLSFYARVTADNLSPSNFAMTNPEVLKLARETGGKSLVDGFRNMLADLEKGYITTTDETAFRVGENLATTPGAVVYRNELIELIQYTPVTPKVRAVPILIVPPCVNKFYIFDINEKKSMIRYLLEKGNSVFIISWRNAGPETRDYDWNDYITRGVMSAMDATADIAKAEKLDLLSWCNGGTLLLAALAVMPTAQKSLVGSATFLSSLLDFSDPGEVKVFIDQPQIAAYKQRLGAAKVAPGRDIARAMAMLHVNESIWGFVVNNYLKGQNPPPSDILYWNADTSNLPAKWYSFFVEEMYHANRLKEPGALTLLGQPVDCGKIDVPCCFVAATGDHIVPWTTSYSSTKLLPNVTEFVLTSGGHVSGTVINHPAGSRRHFLAGGDRSGPAEAWRASAERTEGSWWPHWLGWLDRTSGADERSAPGNPKDPERAAAPGAYVLEEVPQDG